MQRRRFRSSLDPGIVGPLSLAIGWLFPAAAWMLATGRLALGSVLLVSAVIPLVLFLPIRYELGEQVLRIRSGLFVWQIPYPLIRSARRLRSARAAPALSRDRIAIDFDTGDGMDSVLVSPKEEGAFLDALRTLAPGVELEGAEGTPRPEG